MNVSLTPELDSWINQKVNSGLYNSSSEVIREGLRTLIRQEEQKQAMLENLRSEIQLGIRQLDQKQSKIFDQKIISKVKLDSRIKI